MRKDIKKQTVENYIAFFNTFDCPELFDSEAKAYVNALAGMYGKIQTSQAICETRIDTPQKNCDFSVVVSEKNGRTECYWLELDQKWDRISPPCRYLDVSFLKPDMSEEDFISFVQQEVSDFAGRERAEKLSPMLRKVLFAIDGKSKALYQLGAMYGRGENDSLRIFTEMMSIENNLEMLKELGWKGDIEELNAFIKEVLPYCRESYVQLDFDIFEDGISEILGITFDVGVHERTWLVRWLRYLIKNGLCLLEKGADILEWIDTPARKEPCVIPRISHFKFKYKDGVIASKVYLSLECNE